MYKVILFICSIIFLANEKVIAEEIAPGFDACMEQTETMGQENVCVGQAAKYWGQKLESQYNKMRKACNNSSNPQECKKRLKKMQLGWLNYTSGVDEFMREGLFQKKEITSTSDINEALRFELNANKTQYETLVNIESMEHD